MYIRLDDTGVSVSFSEHEFKKTPVIIIDGGEPIINSRINISNFANIKVIALLTLLAIAPFIVLINMTPSPAELSTKRHAEARAHCVEGAVAIEMSSIIGSKTINCGE
jgi:hypothetical protein